MRVFLECKPDERLALTLGVAKRDVTHSHGKGRVAGYLSKHSQVIGLADQDPGSAEPTSFGKYVLVSTLHDVQYREHPESGNRLIVLCPRLEPWVIKTAKASKVKMEDFNLSEIVHDLDAVINQRLPNLGQLLEALLAIKCPRLQYLQSLLRDSS